MLTPLMCHRKLQEKSKQGLSKLRAAMERMDAAAVAINPSAGRSLVPKQSFKQPVAHAQAQHARRCWPCWEFCNISG